MAQNQTPQPDPEPSRSATEGDRQRSALGEPVAPDPVQDAADRTAAGKPAPAGPPDPTDVDVLPEGEQAPY